MYSCTDVRSVVGKEDSRVRADLFPILHKSQFTLQFLSEGMMVAMGGVLKAFAAKPSSALQALPHSHLQERRAAQPQRPVLLLPHTVALPSP